MEKNCRVQLRSNEFPIYRSAILIFTPRQTSQFTMECIPDRTNIMCVYIEIADVLETQSNIFRVYSEK